ncbi:hypothetical protein MBANPS3_011742, partial [Mucor bainieri]
MSSSTFTFTFSIDRSLLERTRQFNINVNLTGQGTMSVNPISNADHPSMMSSFTTSDPQPTSLYPHSSPSASNNGISSIHHVCCVGNNGVSSENSGSRGDVDAVMHDVDNVNRRIKPNDDLNDDGGMLTQIQGSPNSRPPIYIYDDESSDEEECRDIGASIHLPGGQNPIAIESMQHHPSSISTAATTEYRDNLQYNQVNGDLNCSAVESNEEHAHSTVVMDEGYGIHTKNTVDISGCVDNEAGVVNSLSTSASADYSPALPNTLDILDFNQQG